MPETTGLKERPEEINPDEVIKKLDIKTEEQETEIREEIKKSNRYWTKPIPPRIRGDCHEK